jgi:hypothetical protein
MSPIGVSEPTSFRRAICAPVFPAHKDPDPGDASFVWTAVPSSPGVELGEWLRPPPERDAKKRRRRFATISQNQGKREASAIPLTRRRLYEPFALGVTQA